VQPPGRQPRQVVRPLRPERPLVYEKLSDPILVRRVKDGDQQALAALCTRHAARVHRIALHVLRDPDDANDAAQEALVKLVRRVQQFRGDAQFSTWLHRLVVNTCKDVAQARWATEHRTEPLLEDLRVASDGDPARALAISEARRELGACLAELPPAQAAVVALKHGFDVPFEEISAATGLPVGTAKCYAHRARNTLDRAGVRERLTA
jgi:RNA polymerase sigma-70 factor (ECF subfamily)